MRIYRPNNGDMKTRHCRYGKMKALRRKQAENWTYERHTAILKLQKKWGIA